MARRLLLIVLCATLLAVSPSGGDWGTEVTLEVCTVPGHPLCEPFRGAMGFDRAVLQIVFDAVARTLPLDVNAEQ